MSAIANTSFAASSAGTLTLLADIATLVWFTSSPNGVTSLLEAVVAAANLAGFLLGLLSAAAGDGTAGIHLSWTPLVLAFVLLAAYEPQLAADLVRRLAVVVLFIFNGLADVVVEVAGVG